ncbi:GNAT family N-acetyltransferase [Leifsonia shinshuensis]|uniref:GNAT family N-acetyltransferase n=1 Tax=Leifsonia shinshuensis TaxID=150026 RepID=UPI001F5108BB|nr:GNAT family N-acetyltransferase [Leifsonia shinshuensis]MCI0155691.1 GNAT family N-acetyltransferase [Leifsonia shinshuensis]
MTGFDVRPARPEEWAAVGGLRWDSIREFGGEPDDTRAVFAERFAAWAADRDSHECFVAVEDGLVLGMTWLAVVARVPSARRFERASGDLQCAYVVPHRRDDGIGGRLIDAVLARAAELGLERVTVHSSPRAVPVYERHGFSSDDDRLLHAFVVHTDVFAAGDGAGRA